MIPDGCIILGNHDLSWKPDTALSVCAINTAPFSITSADIPAILNVKKIPTLSYIKVGKKMQAVGYAGVDFSGASKSFYAGREYKLSGQKLKLGTTLISANDAIHSMKFTSSVASFVPMVSDK